MNALKRLFAKTDIIDKTALIVEQIRKGALLIDVRAAREAQTNGLSGTVNYPLDDLFKEMINLNKQRAIIVFCTSGNRSRHAKQMLLENGFVAVQDAGKVENMRELIAKAKGNA
jgi:phage shock protein E